MTTPVCGMDEFFLTRLQVEWLEPKKKTDTKLRFSFDYDVARHVDDDFRRRLTFRVSAKSTETPPVGLQFDTEIVGYFCFPKETASELIEQLVRINGCTILYGILRGQLAQTTGSFPGGKFNLPTFMMNDVVAEVEKRKQSKPRGLTGQVAKK